MIWVVLNRTSSVPLFRQIYNQIRDQILTGIIGEGERLPSTREFASQLAVSRNVVLEAYDQLLAEGYVYGVPGSGTRVAAGAGLEGLTGQFERVEVFKDTVETLQGVIDFHSGIPALDLFPLKKWGQLLKEVCQDYRYQVLNYNEPAGRMELRKILAQYLFRTRGIRCAAEQIMITTGATQGLALIAKLLYRSGAKVIVENPMNYGMQMVLAQAGYMMLPVPVDAKGIDTGKLPLNEQARFIYVTPSHQFPLGGVLPIQRRIELVRYARTLNCYIVEDDYDSEFRYTGPPLSSVQILDPTGIIYMGSFSKILAPALRLGYLVLPPPLLEEGFQVKKYTDVHTPVIEQLALSRFIETGLLERHIRKLKKVYISRRQGILRALEEYFPGKHQIFGEATGLHIAVAFEGVEFFEALVKQILQRGVHVYPVEKHTIVKGKYLNQIVLGYSHLKVEEIFEGIRRLSEIF